MKKIFLLLLLTTCLHGNFIEQCGHEISQADLSQLERYEHLFEKNKERLKGDERIPKVVHFIWLGPRSFPRTSVENVRMWMKHHPDWTFKFWTDRERIPPCKNMECVLIQPSHFDFLEEHYESSENWGEKSDILRYEILFREGGVYSDHDANCLRSFDDLHHSYDFYGGLEVPHDEVAGYTISAGIGIIGAKPHHPLIKGCIQAVEERWDEMGKKFSEKDPMTQALRVMHRTYIALTASLQKNLDLNQNRDIVFPASYFYPKDDLEPVYSFHYYGTTWNNLNFTAPEERIWDLLRSVKKQGGVLLRLQKGLLLMLIAGTILLTFMHFRGKKHEV